MTADEVLTQWRSWTRTYCRKPNRGAHEYAAHVFVTWTRVPGRARTACNLNVFEPVLSDRLPPDAHLCGNCSRIVAAETDVEEDTTMGNTL